MPKRFLVALGLVVIEFGVAACSDESGNQHVFGTPSGGVAANGTGGGGTGGVLPSGGVTASGGIGGIAGSGGALVGGTPTGGYVTGGAPAGGIATGGISTGATPATGGTGGAGTTGGTATGGIATGGVPPAPYDHGYVPTTVTADDARAAYDAWAAVHLEDCGSGVYRVRWENGKLDATVSEGIGYGMLLAVSFGEQAVFDGLLAYYQKALNQGGGSPDNPQPATGLMHWLRYGCDAHWDTIYSEYPDGAAADADLDVAMSLIMADCRWGGSGYAAEASRIIGAIRTFMFIDHNGMRVLQPGDSTWFDSMGGGCVNYSYFAPAYYREFAAYDPGNEQFWNGAANDVYTLLANASDSNTGLVRNWGSADGGNATPECNDAYTRAASYGDDAARTPWRIATDYIWNGTAAAKSWNDRVTSWVNSIGITGTAQWYELGGNVDTQAPSPYDHTAINVGPWSVGAMTYDQTTVDSFAAELVSIPAGSGDHDGEYFPRMLRALSLVALTGDFNACGGI